MVFRNRLIKMFVTAFLSMCLVLPAVADSSTSTSSTSSFEPFSDGCGFTVSPTDADGEPAPTSLDFGRWIWNGSGYSSAPDEDPTGSIWIAVVSSTPGDPCIWTVKADAVTFKKDGDETGEVNDGATFTIEGDGPFLGQVDPQKLTITMNDPGDLPAGRYTIELSFTLQDDE